MIAYATYEETALALGLSPTTVRNIERRALAKLRRNPAVISAAKFNGLLRDESQEPKFITTNWEKLT